MFHRVWDRAMLFERMAALLNVNLAIAARLDRGNAVRLAHDRCLTCVHADACKDWFTASDGRTLPPPFCRNADFFSICRDDAPESDGCAAPGPRRQHLQRPYGRSAIAHAGLETKVTPNPRAPSSRT
ncbi:MAG: DUF6455 family protein [Pseudomonadota bacterium]